MTHTVNVFELSKLSLQELVDLKSDLLERILDMHTLLKTIQDDMAIAVLEEQMNEYMYRIGLVKVLINTKQAHINT